ncbi:hypothetical protein HF295_02830 [Hujiaoplasma nucleasis]|uniref:Uncharacterized protein n=1 Tax=Hujiaoplasma nucleasis TaxID=2725268 RepID=A0A7L6N5J9_9MOLU|nr:hypothetical protein [Hujiaoplasma nucleasis]QLY39849.1 hypothetical protein HF295_02830 [Hujiaoplasma nucleasis]
MKQTVFDEGPRRTAPSFTTVCSYETHVCSNEMISLRLKRWSLVPIDI